MSLNSIKLCNLFISDTEDWSLLPSRFVVHGQHLCLMHSFPSALVNVTPQMMPTGTVLWSILSPPLGTCRHLSRHTFIPRCLPGYRKNFKGSVKVRDRRSRASLAQKFHSFTLEGWIGFKQPSVIPEGNKGSQRPECREIKGISLENKTEQGVQSEQFCQVLPQWAEQQARLVMSVRNFKVLRVKDPETHLGKECIVCDSLGLFFKTSSLV